MDFITGLPPSGNTVILTIIDRFSKAVHFIALPKLPSALKAAKIMTQQVFRLHDVPQDIVSDRGPQFTSRVWKEFCKELGSAYLPASTLKLTGKRNELIKNSKRCYVV